MTKSSSRKAHHLKVCEEAVHFRSKRSSCTDVLSHVNSEGHGGFHTRHPLWKNEMDEFHGPFRPRRYMTLIMETTRKKSQRFHPERKLSAEWQTLLTSFMILVNCLLICSPVRLELGTACLALLLYRRFVGCEFDADCFA